MRALRVEGSHQSLQFSRLSWQRLTICLLVEAVALGALSQPATFSTLGMVPGIILTVGIGMLATQASLYLGEVCIRFPGTDHYDKVAELLGGRIAREICAVCFVLQLLLVVGSHVLTGTELLNALSDNAVCSVAFGVVSAVILYLLAIPPSFHDIAWLGYIDFASIIGAIIVTGVGVGKEARAAPGGLGGVQWRLWPRPETTFYEAMLSVTNIIFAYSFAVALPSFMGELAKPHDYKKALISLGAIEIVIYTVTGAAIYALSGDAVQSPALLGAGSLQKAAWGVAIPVVYISGSINTSVAARYAHQRAFKGTLHAVFKTSRSWIAWLLILLAMTAFAFVIAEVIPFFSALLGITSSLFVSFFSFTLPGCCWFLLRKRDGGSMLRGTNAVHLVVAVSIIVIGLFTLGAGTYAAVESIREECECASLAPVD
ncbi:putative amino acid transporter [Tilletiopsis washingtonensis]|uniref:Putative amino acid transporter n=1 Tax=Tilletiopsis washingtonensis TaxID=58919 RepID=A0A316Z8H1_9BASI|nr:putative amino acid transporter [Tilletiopsis washingtonensis]PWN97871.1 putative amino acid transporter [Tilletiopsis washingtonensis]